MDDDDLADLEKKLREDEVNAVAWWLRNSEETKEKIWSAIQKIGEGKPDPIIPKGIMELIAHFAQLGMANVAVLAHKGLSPVPTEGGIDHEASTIPNPALGSGGALSP